jgi:hypothetical protein
MAKIEELTPEIIEAVFDKLFFWVSEEGVPEPHLTESRHFWSIMHNSERIQQKYLHEIFKYLMESGPPSGAEKVEIICAQMFLAGWHARADVDEQEQLKRMYEGNSGSDLM